MAMTYMQRGIGVAVAVAAALAGASCGEVARTGRSPVFLVIEELNAAALAGTTFSGFLNSDVLTKGSTINDVGQADLSVRLKNPGTATAALTPSTLNAVTITRYRVRFERADGQNREGIDIPYGFDGGATVTVPESGNATVVFDLVRHQNKEEAPLRNLRGNGGQSIISTIAIVTFYGHDLAGNAVEGTGKITVNFADYADPA